MRVRAEVGTSNVPTTYSSGSRALRFESSFCFCFCFLLDLALALDFAMRKVAAGFGLFGDED